MIFHKFRVNAPFMIGSSREISFIRLYRFYIRQLFNFYSNQHATNLMDLDWDVLIILDACKYDTFQELNTIEGRLYKINSVGSHTREWARNTFQSNCRDVVYLCGNPILNWEYWKENMEFVPFRQLVNLWDFGWNGGLETVHPKVVNEVFKEVKGENYRIILHYMQPHFPCIHPDGWCRSKLREIEGMMKYTVWEFVKEGFLEESDLIESYELNLSLVLDYVEELLSRIDDKKVIISSDHGNLFGEYGLLTHHEGLYFKELIEVPCLFVN